MKANKDIFDLFRKNQHKLAERPSPIVWRRLERRLDAHQRRNQRSLYRQLSMAAGLLILLGFIALISLSTNKKSNDYLALANSENRHDHFEDLGQLEETTEFLKVVQFSQKIKDRKSNPISEGSKLKKLLPSNLSTQLRLKERHGKLRLNQKIQK